MTLLQLLPQVPLVEQLFDAMNDLSQLLIIEPDKIKMLWNEVIITRGAYLADSLILNKS